ncbi:hypothetical protein HanPSC8_Chr11g0494961 [Helianthus annuus]|nr:hypothetical protein HanPSC8_Chr11g0494961 [Helianthus annuus]
MNRPVAFRQKFRSLLLGCFQWQVDTEAMKPSIKGVPRKLLTYSCL